MEKNGKGSWQAKKSGGEESLAFMWEEEKSFMEHILQKKEVGVG